MTKVFANTVLFLLIAIPAAAEQGPGRAVVSGNVSDPQGARIAAAHVALVPTTSAGGPSIEATTDQQGHFTIRNVTPGSYTLRITAEGFETYTSAEPITVA